MTYRQPPLTKTASAAGSLALLGMFALSGACSDASFTSPGGGSGTLVVEARVAAGNRSVNASAAADYDTEIVVRLSKGGQPFLGATVQVGASGENVALVDATQNGRYRATRTGYDRHYTLEARLGSDYVEGIVLSGPELHTFSAPALGAQVQAGMPLEVVWAASGSDQADLETKDFNSTTIPDTGSYTIPAAGIKGAKGKVFEDQVRLVRRRTLQLTGGGTGSQLTVSVSNEQSFLVLNGL